jgi:secreted PhoX family phosphatase
MLTRKTLHRRQFLRSAMTAAGTVAALPALHGLELVGLHGRLYAGPNGGYGPLFPTPDMRDGVERIALPAGFKYRSFSVAGDVMSDGKLVPLAHDGMAAFATRSGKIRLVRNHEDRNPPGAGTLPPSAGSYDTLAGGGTTTLIVNPYTRQLERDFISLDGTIVNCAGGLTPWKSWITCEETNAGIPQRWGAQHGYCFDVPAGANGPVPSVPLPAMGRFSHEALAVDPRTWIVYETEDAGSNSGFYRFIAKRPGVLVAGGRLQMLAIAGQSNYDTQTGQTVGISLPVRWVDIEDTDPPLTGVSAADNAAVFNQGLAGGGARFGRLEGCWYGNGAIYFISTSGGDAGVGQVWEYRPNRHGGRLTLIFESSGHAELDGPDNIVVTPKGALLLCEDGDEDQYLRGVTLRGEIFDFAVNLQTSHEWAGATFAAADPRWNDDEDDDEDGEEGERGSRGGDWPFSRRSDGITLYVNRQGSTSGLNPPTPGNEGMTFAIWGPWYKGAL